MKLVRLVVSGTQPVPRVQSPPLRWGSPRNLSLSDLISDSRRDQIASADGFTSLVQTSIYSIVRPEVGHEVSSCIMHLMYVIIRTWNLEDFYHSLRISNLTGLRISDLKVAYINGARSSLILSFGLEAHSHSSVLDGQCFLLHDILAILIPSLFSL